jgi:hypothetical protein
MDGVRLLGQIDRAHSALTQKADGAIRAEAVVLRALRVRRGRRSGQGDGGAGHGPEFGVQPAGQHATRAYAVGVQWAPTSRALSHIASQDFAASAPIR